MEYRDRITQLFEQYLRGEYSREELNRLLEHFHYGEDSSHLNGLIDEFLSSPEVTENMDREEQVGRILSKTNAFLQQAVPLPDRTKRPAIIRLVQKSGILRIAAASVLLILSVAWALVYFSGSGPSPKSNIASYDREPGGNRATLTLANGRTINLDSALSGSLAMEDGMEIVKDADGLITYRARDNGKVAGNNTVSTPNGGQYKVILPDGSAVWLNAGSSLSYPTRFVGTERRVRLSGEAYFEVQKAKQPFIVESEGQTVEVLGTHFNISSYRNDPSTKTTLLEGKVGIQGRSPERKVLDPGQQAVLAGALITVKEVDVNEAVAWKNNRFAFNNTDLHQVMRQLERWYNVQVDYQNLPDRKIVASLSRNIKLSVLLAALKETSDVDLKIEEGRVTMAR